MLGAAMLAAAWGGAARADVITHLPTSDMMVALTFDACENRTPATFDRKIVDYLVAEKIPVTLFVSGRFAEHNRDDLKALAAHDFVEIENHSLSHNNHMEQMDDAAVRREVADNDALLFQITGRHTHLFRFPAGNFSPRVLADVEALGYKVVHWTFASGDPIRGLRPGELTQWVLTKTKAGSILVFHINGRGWATGDALPDIVAELRRRNVRFVRLDSLIQ
ncbi:MAG: polysaccharide deacetylase family protein [Telmatospirillum sp.]|nr:polysaccharide deacetylase family protein [Telmatospirillum sp.]